jgi:uncharacterized protein YpuA (DUF1002 family)
MSEIFSFIVGVLATLAVLYAREKKRKKDGHWLYLSTDQLTMIKKMISKERSENRKTIQNIIDEGAKRGDTLSTDKILERVEELKSSYHGTNPELYFGQIDKIKAEFREKYGPNIQIDEAYKVLAEIEDKYGPVG